MSINYRPDIDGLRAIAVVSVIFYHAENSIKNFKILSGGFVGVDIFFVISGFLITSIILKELKSTGSFSFKNFYIKRIKRIIPVLLFVFTITFPFIWLFFVPSSFIDFSKSLFSSLFFVSNHFFYLSGELYDSENSLLKPLMHTWSLSIEEQYYIIFPLILTLIFKFFRNKMFKIFLLIFSISLLSMIYIFPKNESLAFFSFFYKILGIVVRRYGCYFTYSKKKYRLFGRNIKFNSWFTTISIKLYLYNQT